MSALRVLARVDMPTKHSLSIVRAVARWDAAGLRLGHVVPPRRGMHSLSPQHMASRLVKAVNDGDREAVKVLATHLTDDEVLRKVAAGRSDTEQNERGAAEIRGRHDATAAKPSAVCDPYENKGQPLSESQCTQLLPTVSEAWKLTDDSLALVREIKVDNFMKGAQLLTTLAAVSFNDGHFPLLSLDLLIHSYSLLTLIALLTLIPLLSSLLLSSLSLISSPHSSPHSSPNSSPCQVAFLSSPSFSPLLDHHSFHSPCSAPLLTLTP